MDVSNPIIIKTQINFQIRILSKKGNKYNINKVYFVLN